MRHQRYVMISFVGAAILVGVTSQSAASGLIFELGKQFSHLGLQDNLHFGFINTSTAIAVGLAIATFIGLIRSRKAVAFTDEVVGELSKVTWPTKDETIKASTTVVFTTLFTAGLLGGYDLLWKKVADYFLFSQG